MSKKPADNNEKRQFWIVIGIILTNIWLVMVHDVDDGPSWTEKSEGNYSQRWLMVDSKSKMVNGW